MSLDGEKLVQSQKDAIPRTLTRQVIDPSTMEMVSYIIASSRYDTSGQKWNLLVVNEPITNNSTRTTNVFFSLNSTSCSDN